MNILIVHGYFLEGSNIICYLNIKKSEFAENYFYLAKGIKENIEFVGYLNQSKLADLISLMDLCVLSERV